MIHFAASATAHSLLFRTWEEGSQLWSLLLRAAAAPVALCVMPDHVHVLHRRDVSRSLQVAMRSYALWRNHHRGQTGAVWRPLSFTVPKGALKQWRDEKYVHKNPCRAGLSDAPLRWPLCTYRDAVGVSLKPVRSRVPDPARYHRETCRDDHVRFRALPAGAEAPVVAVEQVGDAVSSLFRSPVQNLRRRGPGRSLFLRSARALTDASSAEIAAWARVTPRQVQRSPATFDGAVAHVNRVLGDPRFPGLHDGVLTLQPEWQQYLRRRRIRD